MDHYWIKENLLTYYDGQLPSETDAIVESHLQGCGECRQVLEAWTQVSAVVIRPLQAETSDVFVQDVMRKVRVYEGREAGARWSLFARWAFPALALSMAGFAMALMLVISPVNASSDPWLTGDASNASTEWLANPPSEDQILNSVVAKP